MFRFYMILNSILIIGLIEFSWILSCLSIIPLNISLPFDSIIRYVFSFFHLFGQWILFIPHFWFRWLVSNVIPAYLHLRSMPQRKYHYILLLSGFNVGLIFIWQNNQHRLCLELNSNSNHCSSCALFSSIPGAFVKYILDSNYIIKCISSYPSIVKVSKQHDAYQANRCIESEHSDSALELKKCHHKARLAAIVFIKTRNGTQNMMTWLNWSFWRVPSSMIFYDRFCHITIPGCVPKASCPHLHPQWHLYHCLLPVSKVVSDLCTANVNN